MKKIHLCTSGCTKKMVESIYHKSISDISHDKKYNRQYYTIVDGDDDIIQVLNYDAPVIYRVKEGETALDIMSRGYMVDGDISANDILILKKTSRVTHIVKPLETIDAIADMYGVSVVDIINNNRLSHDKLYIGQLINI